MSSWCILILSFSNVTGHVAVVSVVDVVSLIEHSWIIESIEFIISLFDVVFDTIAILVVNWALLVLLLGHGGLLMTTVMLIVVSLLVLVLLFHLVQFLSQSSGGDQGAVDHSDDNLIISAIIGPG